MAACHAPDSLSLAPSPSVTIPRPNQVCDNYTDGSRLAQCSHWAPPPPEVSRGPHAVGSHPAKSVQWANLCVGCSATESALTTAAQHGTSPPMLSRITTTNLFIVVVTVLSVLSMESMTR